MLFRSFIAILLKLFELEKKSLSFFVALFFTLVAFSLEFFAEVSPTVSFQFKEFIFLALKNDMNIRQICMSFRTNDGYCHIYIFNYKAFVLKVRFKKKQKIFESCN